MTYSWDFVDSTLERLLKVTLQEKVNWEDGTAQAFANVSYGSSELSEQKVTEYVQGQLEQIAEDGMAFP